MRKLPKSFTIEPSVFNALGREATKQGRTRSQLVNMILKTELKKLESKKQ